MRKWREISRFLSLIITLVMIGGGYSLLTEGATGKEDTASAAAQENVVAEAQTQIAGAAVTDLAVPEREITVAAGTEKSKLALPEQLTATLADGSKQDIPVTWDDQGKYDPNTAGLYPFTAVFSDGVNYAGEIPVITVTVQAGEQKAASESGEETKMENAEIQPLTLAGIPNVNSGYPVVLIHESTGVQKGYSSLADAIGGTNGVNTDADPVTVVFMKNYQLTEQDIYASAIMPKYSGLVTFTSTHSYGGATSSGAVTLVSGHAAWGFGRNSVLQDIIIDCSTADAATSYLGAYSADLTIGQNVKVPSGMSIYGGQAPAAVSEGFQVTVKSGNWENISTLPSSYGDGTAKPELMPYSIISIEGSAQVSGYVFASGSSPDMTFINIGANQSSIGYITVWSPLSDKYQLLIGADVTSSAAIRICNSITGSTGGNTNGAVHVRGTLTVAGYVGAKNVTIAASSTVVARGQLAQYNGASGYFGSLTLEEGATFTCNSLSMNLANTPQKITFGANSTLNITGQTLGGVIKENIVKDIAVNGTGAKLVTDYGNPLKVTGSYSGTGTLDLSFFDKATPAGGDQFLNFTTPDNAVASNYAYYGHDKSSNSIKSVGNRIQKDDGDDKYDEDVGDDGYIEYNDGTILADTDNQSIAPAERRFHDLKSAMKWIGTSSGKVDLQFESDYSITSDDSDASKANGQNATINYFGYTVGQVTTKLKFSSNLELPQNGKGVRFGNTVLSPEGDNYIVTNGTPLQIDYDVEVENKTAGASSEPVTSMNIAVGSTNLGYLAGTAKIYVDGGNWKNIGTGMGEAVLFKMWAVDIRLSRNAKITGSMRVDVTTNYKIQLDVAQEMSGDITANTDSLESTNEITLNQKLTAQSIEMNYYKNQVLIDQMGTLTAEQGLDLDGSLKTREAKLKKESKIRGIRSRDFIMYEKATLDVEEYLVISRELVFESGSEVSLTDDLMDDGAVSVYNVQNIKVTGAEAKLFVYDGKHPLRVMGTYTGDLVENASEPAEGSESERYKLGLDFYSIVNDSDPEAEAEDGDVFIDFLYKDNAKDADYTYVGTQKGITEKRENKIVYALSIRLIQGTTTEDYGTLEDALDIIGTDTKAYTIVFKTDYELDAKDRTASATKGGKATITYTSTWQDKENEIRKGSLIFNEAETVMGVMELSAVKTSFKDITITNKNIKTPARIEARGYEVVMDTGIVVNGAIGIHGGSTNASTPRDAKVTLKSGTWYDLLGGTTANSYMVNAFEATISDTAKVTHNIYVRSVSSKCLVKIDSAQILDGDIQIYSGTGATTDRGGELQINANVEVKGIRDVEIKRYGGVVLRNKDMSGTGTNGTNGKVTIKSGCELIAHALTARGIEVNGTASIEGVPITIGGNTTVSYGITAVGDGHLILGVNATIDTTGIDGSEATLVFGQNSTLNLTMDQKTNTDRRVNAIQVNGTGAKLVKSQKNYCLDVRNSFSGGYRLGLCFADGVEAISGDPFLYFELVDKASRANYNYARGTTASSLYEGIAVDMNGKTIIYTSTRVAREGNIVVVRPFGGQRGYTTLKEAMEAIDKEIYDKETADIANGITEKMTYAYQVIFKTGYTMTVDDRTASTSKAAKVDILTYTSQWVDGAGYTQKNVGSLIFNGSVYTNGGLDLNAVKTTFKDITIENKAATVAMIYARAHEVVMSTGITVKSAVGVHGGAIAGSTGDANVTLESGTWYDLLGGTTANNDTVNSFDATIKGTAKVTHNIYVKSATDDCTITIETEEAQALSGGIRFYHGDGVADDTNGDGTADALGNLNLKADVTVTGEGIGLRNLAGDAFNGTITVAKGKTLNTTAFNAKADVVNGTVQATGLTEVGEGGLTLGEGAAMTTPGLASSSGTLTFSKNSTLRLNKQYAETANRSAKNIKVTGTGAKMYIYGRSYGYEIAETYDGGSEDYKLGIAYNNIAVADMISGDGLLYFQKLDVADKNNFTLIDGNNTIEGIGVGSNGRSIIYTSNILLNDGTTTAAYHSLAALLKDVGSNAKAYTITFNSNYAITAEDRAVDNALGGKATLTYTSGTWTDGDGKTQKGTLIFNESGTTIGLLKLNGKKNTFKNINFVNKNADTPARIDAWGHEVVMDTGITVIGNVGIHAGSTTADTGDARMTLSSGTWYDLLAGTTGDAFKVNSFNATIKDTAKVTHNIFVESATTNCILTIDSDQTLTGSIRMYYGTTTDTGGQLNINANVSAAGVLENGKMTGGLVAMRTLADDETKGTVTVAVNKKLTAYNLQGKKIVVNGTAKVTNETMAGSEGITLGTGAAVETGGLGSAAGNLVFGQNSTLRLTMDKKDNATYRRVKNIIVNGTGAKLYPYNKDNPIIVEAAGTYSGGSGETPNTLQLDYQNQTTKTYGDPFLRFTTEDNAKRENYVQGWSGEGLVAKKANDIVYAYGYILLTQASETDGTSYVPQVYDILADALKTVGNSDKSYTILFRRGYVIKDEDRAASLVYGGQATLTYTGKDPSAAVGTANTQVSSFGFFKLAPSATDKKVTITNLNIKGSTEQQQYIVANGRPLVIDSGVAVTEGDIGIQGASTDGNMNGTGGVVKKGDVTVKSGRWKDLWMGGSGNADISKGYTIDASSLTITDAAQVTERIVAVTASDDCTVTIDTDEKQTLSHSIWIYHGDGIPDNQKLGSLNLNSDVTVVNNGIGLRGLDGTLNGTITVGKNATVTTAGLNAKSDLVNGTVKASAITQVGEGGLTLGEGATMETVGLHGGAGNLTFSKDSTLKFTYWQTDAANRMAKNIRVTGTGAELYIYGKQTFDVLGDYDGGEQNYTLGLGYSNKEALEDQNQGIVSGDRFLYFTNPGKAKKKDYTYIGGDGQYETLEVDTDGKTIIYVYTNILLQKKTVETQDSNITETITSEIACNTLENALTRIGNNAGDYNIVFIRDYEMKNSDRTASQTHGGNANLTYTGDGGEQTSGSLIFNNGALDLNAKKTTFENITIENLIATPARIYARAHEVVMGTGITVEGAVGVHGGAVAENTGDAKVTLESGTWYDLLGGTTVNDTVNSFDATITGTAKVTYDIYVRSVTDDCTVTIDTEEAQTLSHIRFYHGDGVADDTNGDGVADELGNLNLKTDVKVTGDGIGLRNLAGDALNGTITVEKGKTMNTTAFNAKAELVNGTVQTAAVTQVGEGGLTLGEGAVMETAGLASGSGNLTFSADSTLKLTSLQGDSNNNITKNIIVNGAGAKLKVYYGSPIDVTGAYTGDDTLELSFHNRSNPGTGAQFLRFTTQENAVSRNYTYAGMANRIYKNMEYIVYSIPRIIVTEGGIQTPYAYLKEALTEIGNESTKEYQIAFIADYKISNGDRVASETKGQKAQLIYTGENPNARDQIATVSDLGLFKMTAAKVTFEKINLKAEGETTGNIIANGYPLVLGDDIQITGKVSANGGSVDENITRGADVTLQSGNWYNLVIGTGDYTVDSFRGVIGGKAKVTNDIYIRTTSANSVLTIDTPQVLAGYIEMHHGGANAAGVGGELHVNANVYSASRIKLMDIGNITSNGKIIIAEDATVTAKDMRAGAVEVNGKAEISGYTTIGGGGLTLGQEALMNTGGLIGGSGALTFAQDSTLRFTAAQATADNRTVDHITVNGTGAKLYTFNKESPLYVVDGYDGGTDSNQLGVAYKDNIQPNPGEPFVTFALSENADDENFTYIGGADGLEWVEIGTDGVSIVYGTTNITLTDKIVVVDPDGTQTGYATLKAALDFIGDQEGAFTVVFTETDQPYVVQADDRSASGVQAAKADLSYVSHYKDAAGVDKAGGLKDMGTFPLAAKSIEFVGIDITGNGDIVTNCHPLTIGGNVTTASGTMNIHATDDAPIAGTADITVESGTWGVIRNNGLGTVTSTEKAQITIRGTAQITSHILVTVTSPESEDCKVTIENDQAGMGNIELYTPQDSEGGILTLNGNITSNRIWMRPESPSGARNGEVWINGNLTTTAAYTADIVSGKISAASGKTVTVGGDIYAGSGGMGGLTIGEGTTVYARGLSGGEGTLTLGKDSTLALTKEQTNGALKRIQDIQVNGTGAKLYVWNKDNPLEVTGSYSGEILGLDYYETYNTSTLPDNYDPFMVFTPNDGRANRDDYTFLRADSNRGDGIDVRANEVVYTNDITRTHERLTLSKMLKGYQIDRNKEFEFTIAIMDSTGTPLPAGTQFAYTGDVVSASGSTSIVANGQLTLDNTGKSTINLKHGQSITIADVPSNCQVRVVETDVTGYTASFFNSAGSVSTETTGADSGIISMTSDARTIAYTNYQKTPTPTGVGEEGFLSKVLILIVLIIAAIVAVLIGVFKHQNLIKVNDRL